MIRRAGNEIRALIAVTCLVILGGCEMLNPDRQLITRAGGKTHLAEDSPEVERLLSGQKARDSEMETFWHGKHSQDDTSERFRVMATDPDRYSPGRREFLLAVSQQSNVTVPEQSYVRLLRHSGVRCNLNATYTTTFIKVRITSGALRDREGWVCEDDIQRTVVWP